MATSKEYLNCMLEKLHGLENITCRQMMGEYIIYYRGKVVGGIYDDRLLVKPVASAAAYLKTVLYELPYEGGRKMLLVDDVDSREYLEGLLAAMYDDLSEPKQKKQKK